MCGRGDLVQVDGVARSLPQRRPLARRVSPTAYGRGSRVVGIPHRDSRRGGAQRFFVRRTAALPARVVSSAKVAVPAPGATAPDLRLRCRVLVRPARTGVRPAR